MTRFINTYYASDYNSIFGRERRFVYNLEDAKDIIESVDTKEEIEDLDTKDKSEIITQSDISIWIWKVETAMELSDGIANSQRLKDKLWKLKSDVLSTSEKSRKFLDLVWEIKLHFIRAEKGKWSIEERITVKHMLNNLKSWFMKFEAVQWFDSKAVLENLKLSVKSVIFNPKIPEEVKQKFIKDYNRSLVIIDLIKIPEDIDNLRERRNAWYHGKLDPESDAELLGKIIWNSFVWAIEMKASVIHRCFLDETIKEENSEWYEIEYHKKSLESFESWVVEVSAKYWIDIKDLQYWSPKKVIDKRIIFTADESQMRYNLYSALEDYFQIDPSLYHDEVDLDLNVVPDVLVSLKDWRQVKLSEVYDDFSKVIEDFRINQFDKFSRPKWDILDTWNEAVEWKLEDLTWMEKIESEIDIKNLFGDDFDSMTPNDLIILIHQLITIIPWAWDVYWGWQDLHSAILWIEPDWNIISGPVEKTFIVIMWILWVSVVWWWLARFWKIEKVEWYISSLKGVVNAINKRVVSWEMSPSVLDSVYEKLPFLRSVADRRKDPGEPDKVVAILKQLTYKIRKDPNWNRFIEITDIWNLKWEDASIALIRLMKQNKAIHVEFSQWVLHSKQWEKLSWALTQNHPLISILRMNEGDRVLSTSFSTLKSVNDDISTSCWDLMKDLFYAIQNENIAKYNASLPEGSQVARLVSKDHKDTARSVPDNIPPEDFMRMLFWDKQKKCEMADEIISRISPKDLEEIALEKWWSVDRLKDEMRSRFNFWVNYSTVGPWDDAKLVAHRDAVTWAKQWWFEEEIKLYNVTAEHTLAQINKYLELEKKLIDKYKWSKFTLDWVEYDAVEEWELSGILIQAVRKGKKIEKPEWLWAELWECSNILNNSLDYIPPFIDMKADIQNAQRISENFANGRISLNSLEKNYKWYADKTQYFEQIQWSDRLKVSVDIIWMWGDNRADFRKVAIEYKTLMDEFAKTWDAATKSRAEKVLLQAWMTVTDRLLSVVWDLKKKYPNIDIRIWWDEFWFHNPDIKKWDEWATNQFLSDINALLEQQNFKWRTTYSFDKRNPEKIYEKLDNQAKISKWTEWLLEQFIDGKSAANDEILSNWWLLEVKKITKPNSVVVTASNDIVQDKELYWVLLDVKEFPKLLKEQNWWEGVISILQVLKWTPKTKEFSLTINWKTVKIKAANDETWLVLNVA